MDGTAERWRRVEDLCDRALALDPSERRTFLASACADDDDLRREVESLLSRESKADGFLRSSMLQEVAHGVMSAQPSTLTGRRLGAYDVGAWLGAGGMGDVYRAHDTRLRREVALKVLPPHLTADPERLARFEREARVLALLNHPHIGGIYGLEEADGVQALVLELIEGETLADRLERGPLTPDKALPLAIQMAEALDHAHRRGVTHRDLKPANVMLTKSGVKLLDFGLAKWRDPQRGYAPAEAASAGSGVVPPELGTVTGAGTILGTLHYMAPEQLEAKGVDARADLFAFGAVLFEMLTGRKAFDGGSQATIIAAVMSTEPPPLSAVQPLAPPALDHVVTVCLAKDPDERWQSAGDVARQLRWIAESGARASDSITEPASRWDRRTRWWMVATAATSLVAIGIAAWIFTRPTPLPEPIQFTIPTGRPYAFLGVSPDGRRLAFAAGEPTGAPELAKWLLAVRPLESMSTLTLAGTEAARMPIWSPDGRFIAFTTNDGKLKKIDASGGPVVTLVDSGVGVGGAWSSQDVILFDRYEGPLFRVPAGGGQATPVTDLDESRQEIWHTSPAFLPDGRRFIYFAESKDPARSGLYLASLDSPARTHLVDVVSNVAYGAGHLVYYRNGALMAQAFDEKNGRVAGDAVRVVEGVDYYPNWLIANFAMSQNGVLAYLPGRGSLFSSRLTWFDSRGRFLDTVGELGSNGHPRLSPDGRRLVFSRGVLDATNHLIYDLWQFDLERNVPAQLTFDRADRSWPTAWSPDSRRVAFSSSRKNNGIFDLYLRGTDGTGADELLYESARTKYATGFSPDGKILLFAEAMGPQKGWDVWALPMTGDRKPFPLIQTRFNESCAVFSPDGRWIAYVSDDSGTRQVYIQPFPPTGLPMRLSTTSGLGPVWIANGRRIVYATGDPRFMAVDVTTSSGRLRAGVARELFMQRRSANSFCGDFDVDRSGERFLLAARPQEWTDATISVILNWPSLLRKR